MWSLEGEERKGGAEGVEFPGHSRAGSQAVGHLEEGVDEVRPQWPVEGALTASSGNAANCSEGGRGTAGVFSQTGGGMAGRTLP